MPITNLQLQEFRQQPNVLISLLNESERFDVYHRLDTWAPQDRQAVLNRALQEVWGDARTGRGTTHKIKIPINHNHYHPEFDTDPTIADIATGFGVRQANARISNILERKREKATGTLWLGMYDRRVDEGVALLLQNTVIPTLYADGFSADTLNKMSILHSGTASSALVVKIESEPIPGSFAVSIGNVGPDNEAFFVDMNQIQSLTRPTGYRNSGGSSEIFRYNITTTSTESALANTNSGRHRGGESHIRTQSLRKGNVPLLVVVSRAYVNTFSSVGGPGYASFHFAIKELMRTVSSNMPKDKDLTTWCSDSAWYIAKDLSKRTGDDDMPNTEALDGVGVVLLPCVEPPKESRLLNLPVFMTGQLRDVSLNGPAPQIKLNSILHHMPASFK